MTCSLLSRFRPKRNLMTVTTVQHYILNCITPLLAARRALSRACVCLDLLTGGPLCVPFFEKSG